VKNPDVMGRMLRGELAQNGVSDNATLWYRAERIPIDDVGMLLGEALRASVDGEERPSKVLVNASRSNVRRSYVKTAPAVLVNIQQAGRGPGLEVLGRLLTDPAMKRPWRELARRVDNELAWQKLWSAIKLALNHARRQQQAPTRKEARRRYLTTARRAKALSNDIREGPLDLRAYDFFTVDDMTANGIANWLSLDSLDRATTAHRLLRQWPSMPDMLEELESRARGMAIAAMYEPRVVERRTGPTNYFIRRLTAYFKEQFRSELRGTVAAISGVILRRPLGKRDVERALSRK
jgi:hypothetical protein